MSLQSIQTSLSALRASRIGMEVHGDNVANASNEAHTRRRVDRSASPEVPSGSGVRVGTGVTVDGVARLRDEFADARVRTLAGDAAQRGTVASLLERAETRVGDPEHGPAAALGEVWAAFSELSDTPSGSAARQEAVAALDRFASSVRDVDAGWEQLASDVATSLTEDVGEVNRLAEELAGLNDAVLRDPDNNVLRDERESVADELAKLTGATISHRDDTVRAQVEGVELVSGTSAAEVTSINGNVLVDGLEVTVGGAVGGQQQVVSEELPELRAQTVNAIDEIVTALNTQHAAGTTVDGDPGGDLLDFDGASLQTLAVAVTPDGLAPGVDDGSGSAPAGDGANAEAIAGLRETDVGSGRPEELIRGVSTELASRTSHARRDGESLQSQLSAAEDTRRSVHAVDLDEELSSLMLEQRSYEAASRVMTTADQALDQLINRTGVVGR